MKPAILWRSLRKGAFVGTLATLGLLTACLAASAQEPIKGRTLIRSGYTRPGTPTDREKNGKVIPIYFDEKADQVKKIMGGTVYFAVYERTGKEGDIWGTGLAGFDEMFIQGRNFKGRFSPNLDTKARYLYLYQVVNDRGLDPTIIKPLALFGDNPPQPIVSTSVRLMVDPRYITSWGHFEHGSFSAVVADRKLNGEIAQAALKEGEEAKKSRIAFSSNPSILDDLPYKRYVKMAPANPLGKLRNGFGVNKDTIGLANSTAIQQIEAEVKNKIQIAAFKQHMLESSKSAKAPAYVQLLVAAENTPNNLLTDESEVVQAYFRADWQGDGIMQNGHHSMVFGFTSDLPPMDEEVRLYDADAAKGGPIKMVANAEGDVPGTAPGTVPTPTPPAPQAPVSGGSSGGMVGGQSGGGGFGMPGGFGGGMGFSRPGVASGFGGGNGGGNSGNGSNTGTGTDNKNDNGNNPPNNGNTQNQTINFNPTMTNFQSQNQSQWQKQHQSQSSSNSCPPGNVVPAPAALLLGLFGLPTLFWLRRRKTTLPIKEEAVG